MKKLFFASLAALLLTACGKSANDIEVVGRWYEYTDANCTEVDSTSFIEFYENQEYARRYHDAGSLEVGTYAHTGKTKANYGNTPATRVTLENPSGETYFIDMVRDEKAVVFVFTYQINEKEHIKYFSKHTPKN